MDVFLDNFYFIWLNSFLAIVAVLFGWLMSKADSLIAKAWTGFLWFIFLPNTIYILTDISHLFESWHEVNSLFKFILIVQYALFSIVGIVTFILSIYFFQKLIDGKNIKKIKNTTFFAIFVLNFIVGFGVVLGGIQRTNSWHIFTDPLRVLKDAMTLISSSELLALSFGTGVLANAIYFIFAPTLIDWHKKIFKK